MRLAGKKILMVVAPERFRDEELVIPRRLLESEGAGVIVASTRSGQVRGMSGATSVATAVIDTVRAAELDAILIVGGDGAEEYLWPHAGLMTLVTEAARERVILGAICLAPAVLARAGLLRGVRATVWKSATAEAALKSAGAELVDADVVEAGRIITARGPEAAAAWASAIVRALLP